MLANAMRDKSVWNNEIKDYSHITTGENEFHVFIFIMQGFFFKWERNG